LKDKETPQFIAQTKAIEFQELYYPQDHKLTQKEQTEAIRFAFSQGIEWAKKNLK
jgi:hypothetical protein